MKKFSLNNIQWQGRFAHKKAVLFTEDNLDAKGSKIQVIKIQPGGHIEPHYHKVRTEVFSVLQGTGIVRRNDEETVCNQGDFLLCPINTIHAFKNTGDEDLIVAIFRTNDPGDTDMLWVEKKYL